MAKTLLLLLGSDVHTNMVSAAYREITKTPHAEAAASITSLSVAKAPMHPSVRAMINTRLSSCDRVVVHYPANMLTEEDWDFFTSLIGDVRVELVRTTTKSLALVRRKVNKKKRDEAKARTNKAPVPAPAPKTSGDAPDLAAMVAKAQEKMTAEKPPKRRAEPVEVTKPGRKRRAKITFPDEDMLRAMMDRDASIRRAGAEFFVLDDRGTEGRVRYLGAGEFQPSNSRAPSTSEVGRNRWAAQACSSLYLEVSDPGDQQQA